MDLLLCHQPSSSLDAGPTGSLPACRSLLTLSSALYPQCISSLPFYSLPLAIFISAMALFSSSKPAVTFLPSPALDLPAMRPSPLCHQSFGLLSAGLGDYFLKAAGFPWYKWQALGTLQPILLILPCSMCPLPLLFGNNLTSGIVLGVLWQFGV